MDQEDRIAKAKAEIKAKFGKAGKKPAKKKVVSTKKNRFTDLSKEEQDKFWDSTGRLKFKEMTGERDYAEFIINRAFELYVDDLTPTEIAVKWDIPEATVNNWCKTQNWEEKIQKIRGTVESKFVASKVKKALSDRQMIDQKHRGIVEWLQSEIKWEIDSPTKDEKEEVRKNIRMKTLKIAVDCYKVLIDQERLIVGIDDEETSDRLPSDFVFQIQGMEGQILENAEQLRNALPSQNPHDYLPAGETLSLNPTQQEQAQTQAGQQQMSPVTIDVQRTGDALDPIIIARSNAFDNKAVPTEKALQPHPVFGYIQMPGMY